ncbi:RNA-directed DNA polymerase, eukaryota [Tanacetum coccineum]
MATLQMEFPNQIQLEQRNDLESDVTNDEIKKAGWECGTDKAPRPDDLPNGCNSSFIALILKIPDANLVKDFRPISLIGSIYKIIAKILTNRLVGVMGGIVNEVQSTFIADRQILDGPFILNEMLSWCKKRKKQSLIFKVDFEKAYDSIRWDFLDDVLRKFGFVDKWCKWIQCCLHSSRGSIIINGSPMDEFKFGKGLKQGDPLSPFLFILIMETLHLSFQRVVNAGMFHGIKLGGTLNLSHMFYADDAIFVGEWSDNNIATLVHVLDCFHKYKPLQLAVLSFIGSTNFVLAVLTINVLSKKGINLMNQLRIKLGNGEMTHFWDDNWCEGGRLKDRFPRVYALEECKDITVGSKLAQPSITQSFRRMPRGGVEQMQVDDLINLVQNISLIPMQDRWTWTLNSSGDFSVASVRSYIDTTMLPKGDYQTRWVNLVPIKVNTFAWKVMTNSLPARFNISRRGIDIDSISCGNCDSGVETATHLFFACDLAKQITRSIMRWWDVPEMDYESYNDWRTWMINVRFPPKHKCMLEGVFYVEWWTLWNFRNNKIFGDKRSSKAMIFDDITCKSFHWCRARSKVLFSWNDWLNNPTLIPMY